MRRRVFIAGGIGMLWVAAPADSARADDAEYRAVAEWLFDLYAGQSVRMSITNALRQRPPGTEQALAPYLPGMVRALERHRALFGAAMIRPLQAQFTAPEISVLLQAAKRAPTPLDETQRAKLFEVDAEFRRDAQDVIRAMTTDIGLMIAATLAEQSPQRQQ